MSTYDEMREDEVKVLRAELAKASTALAELRHILKHVSEGIAGSRASLRNFRNRVPGLLRADATTEDLETYFSAVECRLADIARVCTTEKCACAEADLEGDYLDATDPRRPRGRVISLGARVKRHEPLQPDPKGAA